MKVCRCYPVMALSMIAVSFLVSCASVYEPPREERLPKLDTRDLRRRADIKTDGDVRVRVAALNASESEALFGLPLGRDNIQPVWIEIENGGQQEYLFFPIDVDPDYYAPFELAWKYRHWVQNLSLNELGLRFSREQIPIWVPPQATVSGFVFTRQDEGAKTVAIDLMSSQALKSFDFVVEVPGLEVDYLHVDWDGLYRESDIRDLNDSKLRL